MRRIGTSLAALLFAAASAFAAEEASVADEIVVADWVTACTEGTGAHTCPSISYAVRRWYDEAKLRFICEPSHLLYDDPIVMWGAQGQTHLHHFFGNTGANFASTYQTLRTSGTGSCEGGPLNRTAYWFPALLHPPTQKVVVPYFIELYYAQIRGELAPFTSPVCPGNLQDGRPAACPMEAPRRMERGLRFVMGYMPGSGKFPDTYGGHQNFNWQCVGRGATRNVVGAANNGAGLIRLTLDTTAGIQTGYLMGVSGVNGTTEANSNWVVNLIDATHVDLRLSTFTNAFTSSPSAQIFAGQISGKRMIYDPDTAAAGKASLGFVEDTCAAGNPIWVRLDGPNCWDGVHHGSDHYSNMAFGSQDGFGNVICPATHPKRIVSLTVIIAWPNIGGEADFKEWRLSSDIFNLATYKGGFSFHTDWFGAWKDIVQAAWEQNVNGMNPGPEPPYAGVVTGLLSECPHSESDCPWGGAGVHQTTNGGLGNGTAMKSGDLGNGFTINSIYSEPLRVDMPSQMQTRLIYTK